MEVVSARELQPPEVNYATVSGRVTRRNDLERTSSGSFILVFFVENTMHIDTGDEEDQRIVTNVFRVVAWGNRAQEYDQRVRPGAHVLIEGYLSAMSFEDRRKIMRHRMELTAMGLQVLARAGESGSQPVTQR